MTTHTHTHILFRLSRISLCLHASLYHSPRTYSLHSVCLSVCRHSHSFSVTLALICFAHVLPLNPFLPCSSHISSSMYCNYHLKPFRAATPVLYSYIHLSPLFPHYFSPLPSFPLPSFPFLPPIRLQIPAAFKD